MNRRAKMFLLSTLLTNIGNGVYLLFISKALFDRTNSIFGFGLVLASEFSAKILLQFYAGLIADRFKSLRICIGSDLARGAALAIATALSYQGHLVAAIVVSSLAINFFKPFYIAAAFVFAKTNLSQQSLALYNSLFFTAKHGGLLLGFATAGLLIGHVDVTAAFLINTVSYLASVAILSFSGSAGATPRRDHGLRESLLDQIKDSIQYLVQNPRLGKSLLLACFDPICIYFFNVISVPLVAAQFAGQGRVLSLLQCGFVLGTSLSSLIHGHARIKAGLDAARTGAGFAQALVLLAILFSTNAIVSFVLLIALGFFNTFSYSVLYSQFMREVPSAMAGRVSSFYMLVQSIVLMAFLPALSYLVEHGLGAAFALMASVGVIQSVILIWRGERKGQ